ncbi:hypothetical protein Kpol_479p20 [Vanderwaltozyma polyspora DSM 70294]|uniref:protein-serine/threonine phosphatase n=1 Tax=Vanderwaltozyma polyspora (strain ATCC 22028 / DSM 70294 / BCRC 21397 / CBS 2163 / NBRC 10782 / NRRL Y-8283 / UCD 57-17) TaxID=436907 RepID=A7TQD3_VANPO|nr:uncharacterized protein Kpol_479p20 [Vanderwaltozyma polyspora DSM 70294]EDO15532.1 hypothetical protein Kpol_479p20 [Vanderwaltozyma polyspora DSM 70294]
MGQILSNPIVEKHIESSKDEFTAFGLCDMQGWRMSMEDAHITQLNIGDGSTSKDHIAFYSIFDGHGGSTVSQFCGEKCTSILQKEPNFIKGDLKQCLIDLYLSTDKELLKEPAIRNDHSGCTATSILVSKLQNLVVCANAGDSRTVLSTNGIAKALSYDHKPTLASEKSRIVAAGGFVEMDRVNGNLALSRAIGDFEFKSNDELSPEEQIVTCVPDVMEHSLDYSKDDFVILACDGIWDCLTSQECVDLVNYGISKGDMTLADISSRIIDVCCAPTTEGTGIGCDNMSIVIVALLKENESEDEWFTRIRNKKYQVNETFATKRRKIFNYFQFPENDPNNDDDDKNPVFDVTLRKVSPEEASRDAEKKRISGPVDLLSLEAILGASGIEITTNGENGDGNGAPIITGSALSEMLASLSNAAAGETEPEDFDPEDDDKLQEIK